MSRTPNHMFCFSRRAPGQALTRRRRLLIGLLSLLGTASWAAGPPAAPAGLKLQVRNDGQHFIIEWDRSAPELAHATGARLHIVERTNAPFYLLLTPEQLRAGSLTYGAFPFTDQVQFRMEVIGSSGDSIGEPVEYNRDSAEGSAPPAAPQVAPQSPARPTRTFVPPAPPPARRETPREIVMLDPPGSAVPALPVTSKDLLPSPAAPHWTFAPPSAHGRIESRDETVMLDPPRAAPVPAEPTDILRSPAAERWVFTPPRDLSRPPVHADTVMLDPPWIAARIPTAARTATMLLKMPAAPPYTAGAAVPPIYARPVIRGETSNIGILTIRSEPAGASVEINEHPAGTTPLTIQVSPLGIGFTVTLTKPGFRKWVVQSLVTTQTTYLEAKLLENPR
ncbi:MAG: PEGA domain-containing protein [Acidobacteriia bacterium]|nr:PEGA domain-containing protein [Terriglobia bacterium]